MGRLKLASDDVWFEDDSRFGPQINLDANPFESAMALQPTFIEEVKDDSFAFTLNRELWVEGLCTLDGAVGWNPSSHGDAADTLARLRGFGEDYLTFQMGPYPEPPRTDRSIILEVLAAAGWRFQDDEEFRRFAPHLLR
jgi:hypothetical protein